MVIKLDVTSEKAVKEAMEEAVKKFGRIDVAIPCAGVMIPMMMLTSKGSIDINKFR